MKMFAFITVFFIPVMAIYSNNNQNALGKNEGMDYKASKFSMGNLGGSISKCVKNKLIFNKIDLHCPVGLIRTKGNMKYGIISS